MAAAPSSYPAPTMRKDRREVKSDKQRTRCSKGLCNDWSRKSKAHVWLPLPNLPLWCDGLVSIAGIYCCQQRVCTVRRKTTLFVLCSTTLELTARAKGSVR